MKIRNVWALLPLMVPTAAQAGPQRPLAIGSYEQLAIVMRAADRCGFTAYRISFYLLKNGSKPKAVYTDDDSGSYHCIEAWTKRNAHRIGLLPNP
jgi:hypothetical protein